MRVLSRSIAPNPVQRNRLRWPAIALLVVTATACSAPPGAAGPTGQSSTDPAAATAATAARSGIPSPAALVAPTAEPTTRAANAADGCPVSDQTFVPPSDQLVSLDVTSVDAVDSITFQFGPTSGEPLVPEGSLRASDPPFTLAASGQEFEVDGDSFLEVVFRGQRIADDSSQPVFQGDADISPNLPAVKELVNFDSFEGHMSWIVGYTGGGCVTLDVDEKGGSVAISVEHG
jgi:hypothetical protein